jgi:hypothetical protein
VEPIVLFHDGFVDYSSYTALFSDLRVEFIVAGDSSVEK